MDYGVFVKLEEGIEGLIHNSELSGKIEMFNQVKFYLLQNVKVK